MRFFLAWMLFLGSMSSFAYNGQIMGNQYRQQEVTNMVIQLNQFTQKTTISYKSLFHESTLNILEPFPSPNALPTLRKMIHLTNVMEFLIDDMKISISTILRLNSSLINQEVLDPAKRADIIESSLVD